MGRLPIGYRELPYIESTGTQWIDTGLRLSTALYRFVFDLIPTSLPGSGSSGYSGIMGANGAPQVGFYSGGWTTGIASSSSPYIPIPGTKYHIEYSKNGIGDYWVDGVDTGLRRRGTMTCNLFWVESTPNNAKVKLFAASIINLSDEQKVLDLVPCRRLADGAIGMYDLVSQSFFGNSGTGEFIAGAPVVEPTWGSGLSQVSRKLIMRRAEVMTPGVPLYVRGNECAQRSGGWANYNIKPIDTSYSITRGGRVSLEKTAEMMDVTIVTADIYNLCSNCIAAGRKIDFSKVTRVVADLSVSATSNISWNNSSLRIIISDSLNNNFAIIKESVPIVTGAAHSTKSFDGKFAFDVSDINSEGYLSFLFLRDYGNTFNCSIRCVYLK